MQTKSSYRQQNIHKNNSVTNKVPPLWFRDLNDNNFFYVNQIINKAQWIDRRQSSPNYAQFMIFSVKLFFFKFIERSRLCHSLDVFLCIEGNFFCNIWQTYRYQGNENKFIDGKLVPTNVEAKKSKQILNHDVCTWSSHSELLLLLGWVFLTRLTVVFNIRLGEFRGWSHSSDWH